MSTTLPAPGAYRAKVLEQTKRARAAADALGEEGQRLVSRIVALSEHGISDELATGNVARGDELMRELATHRDKLPHIEQAQRKATDALYRREGEAASEALAAFLAESAQPAVDAFAARVAGPIEDARHIEALVAEFTELCRWAKRTGAPLPSFPTPKGVPGRVLAMLVTLVRENNGIVD
jgi:hypothetical protein